MANKKENKYGIKYYKGTDRIKKISQPPIVVTSKVYDIFEGFEYEELK